MNKKLFTYFVMVSLGAMAIVGCQPEIVEVVKEVPVEKVVEVYLPPGEPVLVGVNLALTGPGAINSVNIINGMKLAAEEINNAGGVLGGRPIKIVAEDNKCIPSEGVSAQTKLVYQDEVSVTLGLACSSVVLAAMPIMEEAQVPNIVSGATNPQIWKQSGIGGNIWNFRTNPPDDVFARIGSKILVESLGYKTFGGLVPENDWGQGVIDAYTESIAELGGEVVAVEFYSEETVDYVPILTKFKDLGADTVILAASADPSIKILSAAAEIGYNIPWSGQAQYFTDQVYKAVGTEGLEDATQVGAWYPIDTSPESVAFVAAFQSAWGYEPPWPSLSGYVSMQVAADAIERAGSDEPAAIRDALEETNLPSPFGPVQYDEYNQNHARVSMAQMKGGELTVLVAEDW